MAAPGGKTLFDGRSVADLRTAVLADIRERASHLDPDSTDSIPQEMFVVGVLGRYDLSIPDLHFDRVFSRDVERDGDRYLEIHVPMAGEPQNLHLSPPGSSTADTIADGLDYEIVDGDLCVYLELGQDSPDAVDLATDELLSIAESRYDEVRAELRSLRRDAYETAVKRYRAETEADRSERFVL